MEIYSSAILYLSEPVGDEFLFKSNNHFANPTALVIPTKLILFGQMTESST